MVQKRKEPRVEVIYDYKHHGDDALCRCGTVWVRVFESRTKRRYVSTGVRILPMEWSDEWWVVGRQDAAQLNAMIREQLEKCKEMVATALETAEEVSTQSMKIDRRDASFLDWAAMEIERDEVCAGTKAHYNSFLWLLEDWGKIRRFEDITPQRIRQFIDWIKQREVRTVSSNGEVVCKPLAQTSVYGYWKRLRKLIRLAQTQGRVPLSATKGVTFDRGKSRERAFLDDEEYKAWLAVQLPSVHLCDARDRFVIQMCTGLSYADLMQIDFTRHIKYGAYETLQGTREKTGEQFFTIILPDAIPVLERWGWTVPKISNQRYNDYLKSVADMAGINKLVTSHVARHTYATRCLAHGVRLEAVQRTLGHASIKTTQIYARMVDKAVLEAFDNMK